MSYELSLEQYKGPLDKLLELVEEKKLEITEISLAEVTTDFLSYLKELEENQPNRSLISDFLVVASRLVLIKSKILLPSLPLDEEEESDIRNLEERLKLYAELKRAQELLKKEWSDLPQMATREFLMGVGPSFYPPSNVTKKKLAQALSRVVGELEKVFKPVEIIKTEVISLKTKIEEILKKLTEKPTGFSELHGRRSRRELVVLFLAILYLIKDQLVSVEQSGHFDEITITKRKVI